jgi:hypothetical protein
LSGSETYRFSQGYDEMISWAELFLTIEHMNSGRYSAE